MRILFDARSVRTPAGVYVFQGLVNSWLRDRRVEAVVAAVPEAFDKSLVPVGVDVVSVATSGWLLHMAHVLRQVADGCRADVIFSPNGLAPCDRRSVAYFQDLSHFRAAIGQYDDWRGWGVRQLRASWRTMAASSWMLAVPISDEIAACVRASVPTPVVCIPNGVDVGEWRWSGSVDRVFVMGGTGARKDETTAVRAWHLMDARARGSTTLCVGGVEPAARRADLEDVASALGISDSVYVIGGMPREAYLRHIAESRLAVSCSTFEAFGLPVTEALAVGAPVICSAIPSHCESLRRSGVGASFAPGSPEDLASTMQRCLDGNGPARLSETPADWSWRSRGIEHVNAYERFI